MDNTYTTGGHRARRRTRRQALLGVGAVAALLAFASAAFACTAFKGTMTATYGTGVSTGQGDGFTHTYCETPTAEGVARPNEVVTVAVGPSSCGTKLSAGNYNVALGQGSLFTSVGGGLYSFSSACGPKTNPSNLNDPTTGTAAVLTVDPQTGTGAVTVALPSSFASSNTVLGDAGGLCVNPATGNASGDGMQVPIFLLAV